MRAVIMDRWEVRETHRGWQWSCPLPRLAGGRNWREATRQETTASARHEPLQRALQPTTQRSCGHQATKAVHVDDEARWPWCRMNAAGLWAAAAGLLLSLACCCWTPAFAALALLLLACSCASLWRWPATDAGLLIKNAFEEAVQRNCLCKN